MQAPRRILVAEAQVPFVHGGAEWHAAALRRAFAARGFLAEAVALPFRWDPREAALRSALAWRLVDVERAGGADVDLFVATRFPTYVAQHPRKVLWLFHPFRQAYDLHDAGIDGFPDTPEGRALHEQVVALDTRALRECRRIFTTSRTNAERLRRYNGVEAEVLRLPLEDVESYAARTPENFVLSVGRLDRLKRTELFVRAAAFLPEGARAVVVGDGPDRAALEALARSLGATARIEFLGRVDDAALKDLYARAGAVFYAPHDEDYGLVPIEAMQSRRAVVTCPDAGGPLEFVTDGETGLVAATDPAAIGVALARLLGNRALARRLGDAGFAAVQDLDWNRVVDALVEVLP
jgi:glycosyltransferase involved in cell wall biosynthesis